MLKMRAKGIFISVIILLVTLGAFAAQSADESSNLKDFERDFERKFAAKFHRTESQAVDFIKEKALSDYKLDVDVSCSEHPPSHTIACRVDHKSLDETLLFILMSCSPSECPDAYKTGATQ